MSIIRATEGMLKAVNDIVEKARGMHDGIPEVTVVLGASGVTRSGQKHGHYAPRSWGSRIIADESKASVSVDGSSSREVYGEILLAGESLERGAVATLGTILHELVHAYCDANEIKDTSNGHRYHNTKFKEKAEEFGLVIEKADTIGWSVTTVPDSTAATYREELDTLEERINVHRLGFQDLEALGLKEKEKSNQLKRKMQCDSCGVPIVVTKKFWELQGNGGGDYEQGAGIICATHNEPYVLFEEEGGDNG